MNKILYFLICSLLLCSCESMVNDLDQDKLPKTESKLVVECYISPQSEIIMVQLTESQPLFGPSTYVPVYIANATVTLSGENGAIVIPYVDSTFTYRISSDKFKIEAGKKYNLVVTDGARTVRASCIVPLKKAEIKSYAIDTVFGYRYDGDTVARIKMSWYDIKGESNYYTLRGYAETELTAPYYDSETGGSKPQRVASKTMLDYTHQDFLVSDTNLDGITFEAPAYYVQLPTKFSFPYKDQMIYSDPRFKAVQFEILNLDEHYYRFYKSLKDHGNADNPFVEPALVYTNIEGGLGCFASYNAGIYLVKP
ncbi:DUF4249 domain-containing protein [Dyadobacter sp. CY312]|uniref:DUF4249 domain-containing protein n=1 Tax=Dyadobacter sp. CY312 TaxID=2907303 RepID=UPI001F316399|nr:DUF4249 domain-containing protein [Dyadobacter sp. CY312]MCE7040329.1 DUF4249 domain-containing protein [Dyadobacter sp. CY312]